MTVRRLLFVHAHPDDESSKGAATAARYVDEGARVTLVTCTGGEAGSVLNESYGREVSPEEMAKVRQRELEEAVAHIGFSVVHQLDYVDSGYHEDLDDVPPGTFAAQPVDVPARDLAALLRRERPHVVVTYPHGGGYPHPDHIMVHDVTLRALGLAAQPEREDLAQFGEAWDVPKVYVNTGFSRERVLGLHEALLAEGHESPFERWLERMRERDAEEPERRERPCSARLRVDRWFDRRDAALRAHATQVDPDGFWFRIPRELERRVYPWECFALVRSTVAVDPPEDDLFSGLDV